MEAAAPERKSPAPPTPACTRLRPPSSPPVRRGAEAGGREKTAQSATYQDAGPGTGCALRAWARPSCTDRPLAHARAHSGNLPRPGPHPGDWVHSQPLPPAPSVARLGQWVPEVAVFLANESRPPPRRPLTERARGKLTSTFPEGRVPAGSRPSPIFPALANPGTAATDCVGTLDASVSGAWVLSRTWSS